MENTRIIKCFIASPEDTSKERELCDKVMREINTSLGSTLGFRLETRKWEKDAHPSIGTDGQAVINAQIGLDYDIFIGIMYKRFGSPTPRAGSGTEEEFDRALALHKEHPEVEIMFYFNREATDLDQIDYEQFGKVNAFREKVRKAGCLTWDYKRPETFEDCLRQHLLMRLTEICKRQPEPEKNDTRTIDRFLSDQLQERRRKHPSFRLMEIDKELFPDGKIELSGIEAISSTKQKMPVSSIVAESWKKPKNHLMIEGEGGIGKTVTLLSLPDRFAPHPVPAVYVQLHELKETNSKEYLEEYIRSRVFQDDEERYQQFIHLTREPWNNGPRVLLLLDGFNEIAHDRRYAVGEDINRWAEKPGIQIITSSRYDIRTYVPIDDDYGRIHLQPLERKTIEKYLKSLEIPLPQRGQWNVLDYPLMLTLYAQTEKVLERMNKTEAQDFKKSNGAGAIIWNYLQRELWRFRDKPEEMVACVLAAEFLAPCMAWQMLHHSQFYLDEDTFLDYFDKAASIIPTLNRKQFPQHIQTVRRRNAAELPKDDALFRFLEKDLNLFVKNGDSYSLMHQQFRDALAALHLINVSHYSSDLPDEWKDPVDPYVMDFVSELSTQKEADQLWELNRLSESSNDNASLNMLELQKQKRNCDFTELSFSRMDLSKISLFPYRFPKSLNLLLPKRSELCEGLSISKRTFYPSGHASRVTTVAISPDGKRCVSGSDDNTLRVWNLNNRNCLQILEGHKEPIISVHITEDGKKCISVSFDNTIRVWNLDNWICEHVFEGHISTIFTVAITPDGKRCISGSFDRTLRVWDLEEGRCIHILEGHKNPVRAITISPDGKRCISGSVDRSIRVWNLDNWNCEHVFEGHISTINTVAITPDGKRCISGSNDESLRVWDMENGSCIHVLEGHEASVNAIVITPDGKRCVSISNDYTLRVWTIENGQCLYTFEGHNNPIRAIAVTPDGKSCISGSADKTLRVWNLDNGRCIHVLNGHEDWIRTIAISPDGKRCVSGSDDKSLRIWDLDNGCCVHVLEGDNNEINTITITPDGKKCVTGSEDKTLRIWDLENRRCVYFTKALIRTAAFSVDGERLITGSDDGKLRVWDLNSRRCIHRLEGHKGPILTVSVLTDGRKSVSGSTDRTLRVWDLENKRCIHVLKGHQNWIRSVAITTDGKRCVSGSDDKTLRVWNLDDGSCIHVLKGHEDWIRTVAIAPDGIRCVSGANDETLRVWDLEQGICVSVLRHHARIRIIGISNDGNFCISLAADNTLRIWDLRNGECLHALQGHKEYILTIAIASDTKRGVKGSQEGVISIIDLNNLTAIHTIKILPIPVIGVDFSKSIIPDNLRETLRQNGAIV